MSLESGSTSSLNYHRDLSQDDGTSTTSGHSSVDLQQSLDDSERLTMLASAVTWIKQELVSLRKCDRNILQQLLRAHSSITDIRKQQKLALLEQQEELENTTTVSYGLENIQEDLESSGHSDYYSTGKSPSFTPQGHTPNHVSVVVNNETSDSRRPSDDDDILRNFLGEENVDKLSYFSHRRSLIAAETGSESFQKAPEREKVNTSSSTKGEQEKKEGRSSVAFEMQLLRQKLQEEAKSELAAFDKEFDTSSTDVPLFLEEEKKSYRYSILNRMDELLYPPSNVEKTHKRYTNHVRQSSEPVAASHMIWNQIPTSPEGSQRKLSRFVSSKSTQFHSRKNSESASDSFRIPTSQTHMQLSRTGSVDGNNDRKDDIAAKFGIQFRTKPNSTHYDTTVIKRRSTSSSRDNTLEKKKKHPLRYSVESLNSDESVRTSPLSNYNYRATQDSFDTPEHKYIAEPEKIQRTNGNGSPTAHQTGKMGTLPSMYRSEKPKLTPMRSYQHPSLQNIEVYPEISSALPFHSPSSGSGNDISPYMKKSLANKHQNAESYSSEVGNNFVNKSYVGGKQHKPLSAPYSKKTADHSNWS